MTGDDTDTSTPAGSGTSWRTVTLVAMALLGAAMLVALILTLAGANRQRDRALELQRHSYDVMILARTLSGTIARSEASLGRYVISGDGGLGQLYFDDWQAAGDQLERLARLTSDNAGQRARIATLRDAYDARGRELSVIALSTRYKKNGQALARYYQARQAPALVAINRALDLVIAHERLLLDRRTAAAMGGVDQASQVAGVLAGFGILLVLGAVALGWITVRSLGERAVAEADAAAAGRRADELASAVADATDELRAQDSRLRQVQKMEAVGQLTGGIAHDFNNMLAVVLGGLELAKRALRGDQPVVRRHLDSATEGAQRAAALTRRLLAFSREEQLKPEPIAVAVLVEEMHDLLDRTLGDGVTVTSRDAASGWRVRADRVQLENAILNLAVNARDAMDGRGELTVTTGAETLAEGAMGGCAAGDYVTVAVADTGCGMSTDVAERVFEPFFTTKEVGKGTGLGLSQVFALVRQLGGAVGIESAPGVGTIVKLHLPRDAAGDVPAASAPAPALAVTAPRGLDILVVEDDPRVLTATMEALSELGHRPVACDDPLAAPAALERMANTDIVVSDVLMPRQTGPEMVAGLVARWPDLPVLFVTGFAGEVNAHEFGGRPVLRKPFTLAALEAALADALGGRDTPPHQIAAE